MPGRGTGSPHRGGLALSARFPPSWSCFLSVQRGHKPSRWTEINKQMTVKHCCGLGSPRKVCVSLTRPSTVSVNMPFGETGSL